MSTSFRIKMALLALAVLSALAFRGALRAGGTGGAAVQASPAAKTAAILTILVWLAIIFLGRAIAYDVEVWGPLSLAPRA